MSRLAGHPPSEIVPIRGIAYPSAKQIKKPNKQHITDLQQIGQRESIIVCRPSDIDPHTIVWGSPILEAARSIGWKTIKAIVLAWAHTDPITKDWIEILMARQKQPLSPYQIAEYATAMTKHNINGSLFARITGISHPYTYNTMRWLRALPPEVKTAWKEGNQLLTQNQLEQYAKMSHEEILKSWRTKQRLMMPFRPHAKNGKKTAPSATKRKRASEPQIVSLQAAIEDAPLLPDVKALCTNILQFVLGHERDVAGITDYRKLPIPLLDKNKIATH